MKGEQVREWDVDSSEVAKQSRVFRENFSKLNVNMVVSGVVLNINFEFSCAYFRN